MALLAQMLGTDGLKSLSQSERNQLEDSLKEDILASESVRSAIQKEIDSRISAHQGIERVNAFRSNMPKS